MDLGPAAPPTNRRWANRNAATSAATVAEDLTFTGPVAGGMTAAVTTCRLLLSGSQLGLTFDGDPLSPGVEGDRRPAGAANMAQLERAWTSHEGHNRPPIESFAGVYEQEEQIRQWVVAFGEWSPVISARLIEVCQNFGWQSNVDSWLIVRNG